ncbi:MAG: hypothetical protein GY847_11960 [Proteobacteria bacterium]|nr:hypothetical protein [Pseudomonadota bacterium]
MRNSKQTQKLAATIITIAMLSMASVVSADEQATSNEASTALSTKAEVGERPPFYVNFMLSGAMLHEDSDNRLTSYDSSGLITPGLALRAGGVVKKDHLIGGIFQANWRATQKVLDNVGGDNEWGEVANFYVGPEYRYQTQFGLYAGASLGFVYTLADNSFDGDDEPDCSSYDCLEDHMERSDDQGVPGVGARAVVGWEYRFKRTLAINVEAFGGFFHGENEDDENMTTPTYGLALGVGI